MAKNILVISVDIRETRVALIEDGVIAELHIERRGSSSHTVGNVYLGKVTRVLPGLQAAFIDIGQERAAFLHVEDLIRPDDFEAYLAGGRKHALQEEVVSEEDADSAEQQAQATATATDAGTNGVSTDHEMAAGEGADDSNLSETDDFGPDSSASPAPPESDSRLVASESDEGSSPDVAEATDWDGGRPSILTPGLGTPEDFAAETPSPLPHVTALSVDEHELPTREFATVRDSDAPPSSEQPLSAKEPTDVGAGFYSSPTLPEVEAAASSQQIIEAAAVEEDDLFDDPSLPGFTITDPDMPGFTISEPGQPVPRAAAPRASGDRGRRDRNRGRRGRGRGGNREGQGGQRDRRPHKGHNASMPGRISKSTPIREVVSEGQEIIVQVTKDPIGTKGARCSSHVSLPGRYVVYMPTVDHIGISKRIGSEKERSRLREAIEGMKPPSGGLIVRTVAEGLTKKQLKQDVGYLVRLWGEIAKKREGAKAPNLLASELDLVLKTARDLFTDEVEQIVIDDKHQYDRLCRFVEMFAPERLRNIILYSGEEPIFDAYGIEDEIARALSRKVPLTSGGYLVIDEAEALTAIDVNTGRFVGKGSKDMEETILKTNLEAVEEIAYQLRFRNIGGLIILDLIDMEKHQNREKVRKRLEELLQKDKAKTTLNRISDLGLIEMTRKRTRESLGRLMHEPCFYCDGTGHLQSKETIAFEILREIRRKKNDLPGYTVLVNAHPAVVDVLQTTEKAALHEAENRFMRKINMVPRKDYHIEQFDMTGK